MFRKRSDPRTRANSLVPDPTNIPEPKPLPPTKMWRVEMTDGYRNIEANGYWKRDGYVAFYRHVGSNWTGPWAFMDNGYRHRWVNKIVVELNSDYVMSIEESI